MDRPHSWDRVTVTKELRRDSAIDPDEYFINLAKERLAKRLVQLMEVELTWETYEEVQRKMDMRLPPPVGTETVPDDWVVTMLTRLPGFEWPPGATD